MFAKLEIYFFHYLYPKTLMSYMSMKMRLLTHELVQLYSNLMKFVGEQVLYLYKLYLVDQLSKVNQVIHKLILNEDASLILDFKI